MMLSVAAAVWLVAAHAKPGGGEPKKAEYAVRWDAARGALATAEEVLAVLGAPAAKPDVSEVRYYDLKQAPAGTPRDATVILRKRVDAAGGSEIRLKYRLAHPLPELRCPDFAAFDRKAEVDIGFGVDAPSRVYSYSCVTSADEPPAALGAAPKPCASKMARYEVAAPLGGKYKLEVWTLPDGSTSLEISRTAPNSVDELARFAALVEKLRARGVRPLDVSKTELGSRCNPAN
jgi:hypothetical protein